jgi:hypothetical protein
MAETRFIGAERRFSTSEFTPNQVITSIVFCPDRLSIDGHRTGGHISSLHDAYQVSMAGHALVFALSFGRGLLGPAHTHKQKIPDRN